VDGNHFFVAQISCQNFHLTALHTLALALALEEEELKLAKECTLSAHVQTSFNKFLLNFLHQILPVFLPMTKNDVLFFG
jgi:hypothetical protein